ncbi:MAG: hypothetical protein ACR2QW_11490 [bacterium]
MKLTFGGGINEINDIAISPDEAVSGQNFELGLGNTKFKRRAPFDLLDTATNTSEIHGIHQLITRAAVKTTLVAAGTTMYEWDGATFTSRGTIDADSELHHVEWDLDSTIVIVDRTQSDRVWEWDGTTLSALTTGLATTHFYAKYGIVQNGRMVFGNVADGNGSPTSLNPHMLLFSAFEDRESYDTTKRSGDASFTTGNEAFYILTPDLQPINGLIRFKRSTIVSTEGGQLFELVGDDSTNYRFEPFYGGSGAIGTDSFVNANDDVYYMRQGGVIESLRGTVAYGDVGTDDISLPIQDTVKNLTSTRAVYDQTNQKILFWTGSEILVLFKNLIRSELSPWSIYRTTHASNFSTKAAVYMEKADSTDKTILFGDDSGNIYDLNGVGISGDSDTESIVAIRKIPLQEFNYENFLEGRVFYRREGACELSITLEWGDEGSTTNLVVPIKGRSGASNVNYFGGGKYFGGGDYFGEGDPVGNPYSRGFSAIGKGSSVFVEFQIDTVNEFEIDYIETP